jgi:signal transduction histidine kinase
MDPQPLCCWHTEQISPHHCPNFRAGDEALLFDRKSRFLKRCLECHLFVEDLQNLRQGQSAGDLAELFPFAIEELLTLRAENQLLEQKLRGLDQRSTFLREVDQVLQSSVERDEVISMVLTAVTAGKGLALNRAILLLVDRDSQTLTGHLAVGPRDRDEAGRIWHEVSSDDLSLREMAQKLREEKFESERHRWQELLTQLSVPMSDKDHLFIKVLNDKQSCHILDLSREADITPQQISALGVKELLLVPLIRQQRRVGLLLADNLINQYPLTRDHLEALETFAAPVASAIERSALHERLQEELEHSTAVNRRLKEQQEQMVRMEKMALIGKLTADVAHSIRNPLTVIGGYARSLARKAGTDDPRRETLEIMARESRRLEEALREILIYAETRHPTFDDWDINQLLTAVYAGLQEDLQLSAARLDLNLAPDLPSVRIDYRQLHHCLRSILHLLLAAAGEESNLHAVTRQAGEQVCITLSGDRLDPLQLPESSSTAPDLKGESTGIGLALCARALEGQNSSLQIETPQPDQLQLIITIPVSKEEQHGSHPDS